MAEQRLIGAPRTPPALAAGFVVSLAGGEVTWRVPVVYRETDPVEGERTRELAISPRVTVALEQGVVVFPDSAARRVHLRVHANAAAAEAIARLRAPAGWRVEPAAIALAGLKEGETRGVELTLSPPATPSVAEIEALVEVGGETFSRAAVTIDHRHIPPQLVLRPATARALRVDLLHDGRSVGYVMGPGDEIPGVLRQLGYEVVELSDEDLAGGDLDRFDAIVTGVRAYNTREALRDAQPRLLGYVERGGTLVVQYNTSRDLVTGKLGPMPFAISRDRVTEENAPVELSAPAHRLLVAPNRISQADFAGWVQERGLYFPADWDPRYETVITTHDRGEKPLAGAILFARHGKGAYVYTSLAFFRQLPAGVPGAIRLFANLLAAQGAS